MKGELERNRKRESRRSFWRQLLGMGLGAGGIAIMVKELISAGLVSPTDVFPDYVKTDGLTMDFTAGAAITAQQVVAITGDNTVSPADNNLRSESIGVALESVAQAETVEVLIYGKTTVVADGSISAGDPVQAASTAGRVISYTTHSHSNPTTGTPSATKDVLTEVTHDSGECPDGHANCVVGIVSSSATAVAHNTHTHTQSSTGTKNNARVVGKALTAGGSGDSIDILVCLAG